MIATIVSSPTFAAFIGLGVYAAFGNPRSAK
jgi:hypothetical protein